MLTAEKVESLEYQLECIKAARKAVQDAHQPSGNFAGQEAALGALSQWQNEVSARLSK